MSNDEKPDRSPDALVEKIVHLNAQTPGSLPPEMREKAIRAEESGTPWYLNDEEMHVMVERLIQVRNQLTIGELLDSISEEHLGGRQATLNQLMRVADVGVDLFYAVISHRDVTPEVLEEARGRWGPLVDAALEEMNESIERRDPVTGEFTVHVWPPEQTARRT